jgi:hypothetical protein
LFLISMLVFGSVGSTTVQAQPIRSDESPCDSGQLAARDWLEGFIESHGRSPRYDEIVTLPRSMAEWAVLSLPAQDQHAFWQAHMHAFLATPLNRAEQDALLRASGLLTVELFERAEREGSSAVDAELRQIRGVLSAAFDENDVGDIVALFPGGPERLPAVENPCGCHTLSPDDCFAWPLWICVESYNDCEPTNHGCGEFFLYPCNGDCWFWFRPGSDCL